MKFAFFVLSAYLCLLLIFPAGGGSGSIIWWCHQTPHPNPCKFDMRPVKNVTFIGRSKFLNMAVDMALGQTFHGLNHIRSLKLKYLNKHEKAALSACRVFYEMTIRHLNKSTQTSAQKPTSFDVQTWLSAALTNIHTCETGLTELNITGNILPLTSNNVSKLITNTLAINAASASVEKQTFQKGFPKWFSPKDRKVLQF